MIEKINIDVASCFKGDSLFIVGVRDIHSGKMNLLGTAPKSGKILGSEEIFGKMESFYAGIVPICNGNAVNIFQGG